MLIESTFIPKSSVLGNPIELITAINENNELTLTIGYSMTCIHRGHKLMRFHIIPKNPHVMINFLAIIKLQIYIKSIVEDPECRYDDRSQTLLILFK